ncbi:MAG: DUF2339 domain-containing protein, partial [Clostridiales bacterium]|nr:DUF2339 domain-containing protein [Clostridiales bacterium]
ALENAGLKAELEKLRQDHEKASSNARDLALENAGLKNALYEQIYNEKVKIINSTGQKLDIYFRSNIDGELNKLTALENNVRVRIKNIRETLSRHNIDTKDDIYPRLEELSAMLDHKVTEARAEAARITGAFSQDELLELEALKKEQISDEQIREVSKKNNLERFVGLNLLNIIGIFLLVIGAITAASYTYTRLPDLLKGIMIFVLGGAMLAFGEILNRKKANVFSLGLSAGGIAILYVALATSFFGLHILTVYPALALCVLITAGAFVLSGRYNSQTIAAFALIGGYLPIITINAAHDLIYGAMIYLIALNLLALLISFSKKWRLSSFIGLFLNIIGTAYICWNLNSGGSFGGKAVVILYVIFAFLVYTAIPVISTYHTKTKFRKSDVVLLAINTFFSSLIMYGVFYSFGFENYNGFLAIILAAVYLLLGRFVEKGFAGAERHTSALFYLTGLAFVVLVVPIQFGRAWLSLGWLAEGVLLAAYGILQSEKSFKQAGFVISLLCLWAFLQIDCLAYAGKSIFVWKYSAITLGSLVILAAYMYKKMMSGGFAKVYKYFVLANFWYYAIYIIGRLGGRLPAGINGYNIDYLFSAVSVVATFFIAYAICRIKLLHDSGTKILSFMLYIIGIIWLAVINTTNSPVDPVFLKGPGISLGITLIGTGILLVLGLLSVLSLRDLMKTIVAGRKVGIEWYPLILSGYFIVILTQNLITQFDLAFSSAVISVIYVLAALAWIIFGFLRRYAFIRRFGLILAVLAVAKLFLIDLYNLTQGYRILAYFALGLTLIAISFVYQYFSKRLELGTVIKKEAIADGEKDNN